MRFRLNFSAASVLLGHGIAKGMPRGMARSVKQISYLEH